MSLDTMASITEDPIDLTDDRPVAVRRKRRASSGLVDPNGTPNNHNTCKTEEKEDSGVCPVPKTPGKSKKRVRFSDPGPELASSSSSTGLTPYVGRTSLGPRTFHGGDSSPLLRPKASRRLSLPTSLPNALPSATLSVFSSPCTPLTISGDVQWAPLRQVLDHRVRRRLRRNHLSEEQHDIEIEKKSAKQYRQEIAGLKEELESAKQNENGKDSNADRVLQLETELGSLKQEMREHEAELGSIPQGDAASVSPAPEGIYIDDTAIDFADDDVEESSVLRDRVPLAQQSSDLHPAPADISDAATQASISLPTESNSLREARLSLEYLFPGEIALGLVPENPKPLLDIMLERLRSLKTQVLIAEDSLSNTQTQESNLRTQFNAMLLQLGRAQKCAQDMGGRHAKEQARANLSQQQLEVLQRTATEAANHADDLAQENQDKDSSIQKLQCALDKYRDEVNKLEGLISRLEDDNTRAVSALRMEHDEAVADLECLVASETTGRREAENQLVRRDTRIKELRYREQELLATVNEKQAIIREMEAALAAEHTTLTTEQGVLSQERSAREREVGQLNVQIGTLSSSLHEAKQQCVHAERTRDVLLRKLEEEKLAGLRAIDAVREEMQQCSQNALGIKNAHASDSRRRGADVVEHKGLLTPGSVTRFRDADDGGEIEGYVEIGRGKTKRRARPDSGIGVLEEDEDEDMLDMLDMM